MAAPTIQIDEAPEADVKGKEVKKHVIGTEYSGNLDVYVEGDLSTSRPVVMTVHDIGTNHKSFHFFLHHASMNSVSRNVIFVHVDLPGQGSGAPDLGDSFPYPTMDQIANDLVCVLDQLRIQYVVGLGEGAGANIVARFALLHPKRIIGACLIHPTSTKAGMMEFFKDKFISWKLTSGHNPSSDDYLIFHKFGEQIENASTAADREQLIEEYKQHLKQFINPRNLKLYVEAFLNRTDISGQLGNGRVDFLVAVGAKASHSHTTQTFVAKCNPQKVTFLKVDGVGDVLCESPEKVSHGFLLFLQGLGLLSSTPIPGKERLGSGSFSKQRSMSMEEADQPQRRRYSGSERRQ